MISYRLKKEYQNKRVAVAIGDRSFGIDGNFYGTYSNANNLIEDNKVLFSKYFETLEGEEIIPQVEEVQEVVQEVVKPKRRKKS